MHTNSSHSILSDTGTEFIMLLESDRLLMDKHILLIHLTGVLVSYLGKHFTGLGIRNLNLDTSPIYGFLCP